mmetsp:Transcript_15976/g.29209  ORF Transcript_15976/g.29209 Transcript_15976/m.29209 type:complete len:554 (-) Transcript_15976:128-1789(-)
MRRGSSGGVAARGRGRANGTELGERGRRGEAAGGRNAMRGAATRGTRSATAPGLASRPATRKPAAVTSKIGSLPSRASAPGRGELLAVTHGKGSCVVVSPDGSMVALANGSSVKVCQVPKQNGEPLRILRKVSTLDKVDQLEWSSDSHLLMCAQYSRAIVQLFSIQDTTWTCKVSEGIAGLAHACLGPAGRHVLTVADFQLHIGVWSLNGTQHTIENPKLPGKAGYQFSEDAGFLAVLHRRECRDSLSIHSTATWKMLIHFPVATTDADEIAWNSTSDAIVVRDNAIEYAVLVYCPANGDLMGRYSAYENALGVRCMAWSPDGASLAVGSYDQVCRVLDSASWRPVAEFEHPGAVNRKDVALFVEENTESENAKPTPNESSAPSSSQHLHRFKVTKQDPKHELPRSGVSTLAWSFDGTFLATREEQKPCSVWIWKLEKEDPYCVLEFHNKVNALKWDPVRNRLAIATGEKLAHLWSPLAQTQFALSQVRPTCHIQPPKEEENKPVPIPENPELPTWNDRALGLRWMPTGEALLLIGKSSAAFAVLSPEQQTSL